MEQVHLPHPQPAPDTRQNPPDYTVPKEVIVNTEKHAEAMAACQVTEPFDDEGARNGFIQKVLALLLLQSVGVLIIMLTFTINQYPWHYTITYNRAILIPVTVVAYFATLGLLVYCTEARKKTFYKYTFFIMYPLSFGLFLAITTFDFALVELTYVWVFFCLVLSVLLFLSIFSFQTKLRFSVRNIVFTIAGSLIVMFGINAIWILPYYMSNFTIVYLTLGVFMLSTYVLCDMLVMTGKHYRFEVTPSDYALCALYLHLDYAFLFKLWYKNKLKPALENYL